MKLCRMNFWLKRTNIQNQARPVKRQSWKNACIRGKFPETRVYSQNIFHIVYYMHEHASYLRYLQFLRINAGQ